MSDEEPMDDDGYPTNETLARITAWPYDDVVGLLVFLKSIWWNAGWCWHRQRGRRLWISTGGWSGNEDAIGALQDNRVVWSLCFEQHRRGGHYVLNVPKNLVKKMPVLIVPEPPA